MGDAGGDLIDVMAGAEKAHRARDFLVRVADQGFVTQGDHAIRPSAVEITRQLRHLKPFAHKTLKVRATGAGVIGATGLGPQQPHFLGDDRGRRVAPIAHHVDKARLGEDFPQQVERVNVIWGLIALEPDRRLEVALAQLLQKDEARESVKILAGEAGKIAIIVIDEGVVEGLPLIVFGKQATDILKQPIREMPLAGAVDGGVAIQHKLHPCGAGFRRPDHEKQGAPQTFGNFHLLRHGRAALPDQYGRHPTVATPPL